MHHGPDGLTAIARRVQRLTAALAAGLQQLGLDVAAAPAFDTLRLRLDQPRGWIERLEAAGFNLLPLPDGAGISLDDCSDESEVQA